MTGFAHIQKLTQMGTLFVELRSVNSRFLELNLRMPEEIRVYEGKIRSLLTKRIARGKVECRMSMVAEEGTRQELNPQALAALMTLQGEVLKLQPEAKALTVSNILQFPGILKARSIDEEKFEAEVFEALEEALTVFGEARHREGEALAGVLNGYCDQIVATVEEIAPKIPLILEAIKAKLTERLEDALSKALTEHATLTKDEVSDRIRQEVTMYALRMDVDEEINRLLTHVKEVRRVLATGGQVGRKLDFMMQEMNRESNTLGSKAVAIEMTNASLALKLTIEQMREQIQNLE
ncbi:MAG: YicC family protein [Burkholderiaceae bacterium]|nr:YicC family protein [Burkholderiaceae bacterium]